MTDREQIVALLEDVLWDLQGNRKNATDADVIYDFGIRIEQTVTILAMVDRWWRTE